MMSGRWCRDGSRTDAGGSGGNDIDIDSAGTGDEPWRRCRPSSCRPRGRRSSRWRGARTWRRRGGRREPAGGRGARGGSVRGRREGYYVAPRWPTGRAKRSSRRVRGRRGARTHLVHAGAAGEGGGLAGLHGDGGGEGSDGGHCYGRDARGGMRARRDAPYTSARIGHTAGSQGAEHINATQHSDRRNRTTDQNAQPRFRKRIFSSTVVTMLFAKNHTLETHTGCYSSRQLASSLRVGPPEIPAAQQQREEFPSNRVVSRRLRSPHGCQSSEKFLCSLTTSTTLGFRLFRLVLSRPLPSRRVGSVAPVRALEKLDNALASVNPRPSPPRTFPSPGFARRAGAAAAASASRKIS